MSTNESALRAELNTKLLRAVAKNSLLYDRSDENYRKRLPSENCWDVVASEVGESVDKCKRRWRQIRNDYSRWLVADANKRRTGQRRTPFALADQLKFLQPHIQMAEGSIEDDDDEEQESGGAECEQDGNSRPKTYNGAPMAEQKAVARNPMTEASLAEPEPKSSKIADQVKKKQQRQSELEAEEQLSEAVELSEENEGEVASDDDELTSSPTPEKQEPTESEFFVKQRSGAGIILGKKQVTRSTPDPLEQLMELDDSRTRRSRGRPRVDYKSAVQKPVEQRLTRLQRRKSMSLAVVQSMRSPTSPVKMLPLPKQQIKSPQQHKQQQTQRKSMPVRTDDIFPRPGASDSLIFPKPRQNSSLLRPAPQSVKTAAAAAAASAAAIAAAAAATTTATATGRAGNNSSTNKARRQSHVHSIGEIMEPMDPLILSPSPVNGAITSSTNNIISTPILPKKEDSSQRCERSTQFECMNIGSDEHFLDVIRPQMGEMNARQKMKFKQKVFQSLMETFDDATDFPNAGEVQHFNINTPSGFEHVSDPELRLVRELVSMIGAAKHTTMPEQQQPAAVAGGGFPASPQVARINREEPNAQRQLVQRVYKQGGVATHVEAPDKRVFRILQMSGPKTNGGSPKAAGGEINAGARVGTFVIPPAAAAKATTIATAKQPTGSVPHDVSTLSTLFGSSTGTALAAASPAASASMSSSSSSSSALPKNAAMLNASRQMSRRYSICGSGGPNSVVHAGLELNRLTKTSADAEGTSNALKRRLVTNTNGSAPVPLLQQRMRYSSGANVNIVGAGAQVDGVIGRNVAVRTVSAQSGANNQGKQPSPSGSTSSTGSSSTALKTPQIASVSSSGYTFATPTAVGIQNGSDSSVKRGLVVANPKSVAPHTIPTVGRPTNKQVNERAQTLTQLLSEMRQPPPSSTSPVRVRQAQKQAQPQETAATIAADDFSMPFLKREPTEGDEHDILGI